MNEFVKLDVRPLASVLDAPVPVDSASQDWPGRPLTSAVERWLSTELAEARISMPSCLEVTESAAVMLLGTWPRASIAPSRCRVAGLVDGSAPIADTTAGPFTYERTSDPAGSASSVETNPGCERSPAPPDASTIASNTAGAATTA